MKNRSIRQIAWIVLGCICLGLGTVGIALPILPTVPLYMATAFCFAKSSKRLYDWFLGTHLYKKHLESFAKSRAMTLRSKLTVMGTVTLVMAVGFLMMREVLIGRICLSIVWVCHVLYFTFRVRTIKTSEEISCD